MFSRSVSSPNVYMGLAMNDKDDWMDWYGYQPAREQVPEQAVATKEESNGS